MKLPHWQWRGRTREGVSRYQGNSDVPSVWAHRLLWSIGAAEALAGLGVLLSAPYTGHADLPLAAALVLPHGGSARAEDVAFEISDACGNGCCDEEEPKRNYGPCDCQPRGTLFQWSYGTSFSGGSPGFDEPLVTVRGGAYFFVPGRAALEFLASDGMMAELQGRPSKPAKSKPKNDTHATTA